MRTAWALQERNTHVVHRLLWALGTSTTRASPPVSSSERRGALMARLPAECNICGAKFPAPINVSPGTQVHISRVQVQCPYCMSMAAGVPDAVYEVFNEITEVLLSAP